jgi:Putative undecaprenyl diphosphate synthase
MLSQIPGRQRRLVFRLTDFPFGSHLGSICHLSTASIPDPEMIIRTRGECQLSNFLLWDCAYTEIYITDTLWPDFDVRCWQEAVEWYGHQQQRFGARLDKSHKNDHYHEKGTSTDTGINCSTRMGTKTIATMATMPVNGDAT